MNICLACLILFVAAFAGNVTGYWIGYKAGPSLFSKPDSKLFKQEYVDKTHRVLQQLRRPGHRPGPLRADRADVHHGDRRRRADGLQEVPHLQRDRRLLWAAGVTLAGYFLGNVEFVKNNIEFILILVVFVSVVPIIFEYVKHRRQRAGLE